MTYNVFGGMLNLTHFQLYRTCDKKVACLAVIIIGKVFMPVSSTSDVITADL